MGAVGSVQPVTPVAAATPPAPVATASAAPDDGNALQAPLSPGATPANDLPGDPRKVGQQDLRKAVKDANAALAANGTQLVFVFDDQTHHFAVKLLDIQTQKVVQELPPAAMRAAASALAGPPASGTLVDTKA